MSVDKVVFIFCALCTVFWLGLEVGYTRSSVALKPCPMEQGKEVVSRTADTCTYVRSTYGRGKYERKV